MMTDSNAERFDVLWPGGPSAIEAIEPAPRLSTLAGKRIGFLWDGVFRGDEIYAMLEEDLRAVEPTVSFVGHDRFGSIFGGEEHAVIESLPARLRALDIDAVVTGNGC